MLNQFSRTQLVLGGEAMDVLAGSRVAVFGIGGVGGYTVEALARSGVGALDLIDDDRKIQGRCGFGACAFYQSQLQGHDVQNVLPARGGKSV